jgi:hypothetical protein
VRIGGLFRQGNAKESKKRKKEKKEKKEGIGQRKQRFWRQKKDRLND